MKYEMCGCLCVMKRERVCMCGSACVRKIGLFKGPEVSEGLMVAGQAG